ncbi:MAG: hypothetical protein LVT47_01125 [Cyanobacteria bacterium LVE1205-1]|jgi:hypothetical protein
MTNNPQLLVIAELITFLFVIIGLLIAILTQQLTFLILSLLLSLGFGLWNRLWQPDLSRQGGAGQIQRFYRQVNGDLQRFRQQLAQQEGQIHQLLSSMEGTDNKGSDFVNPEGVILKIYQFPLHNFSKIIKHWNRQ